jgi:hypothetical protein
MRLQRTLAGLVFCVAWIGGAVADEMKAGSGTLHVSCRWVSGPAPNPQLLVEIEVSPADRRVKTIYKNADGSKLFASDVTSISGETVHGKKTSTDDDSHVESVYVGEHSAIWSVSGTFVFGKMFPPPNSTRWFRQQSHYLNFSSGEYIEQIVTFAVGNPEPADFVVYHCN